jgi:hypothetical protein
MTLVAVLLSAAPVVQIDVASSRAGIEPAGVRRVVALEPRSTAERATNDHAPDPEPRVEPEAPAPARRPTVRVLLEAGGQGMLGSALRLWGAGARVGIEPEAVLGVEADLRIDHGAVHVPLGTFSADRATVGVSFAAHSRFDAVGLKTLAGLRGGPAWLGGSAVGPWVGFLVGGAATLDVGLLCAELGVEVGAPLAGVVATVGGVSAVALNNFWIGARIAIGARL